MRWGLVTSLQVQCLMDGIEGGGSFYDIFIMVDEYRDVMCRGGYRQEFVGTYEIKCLLPTRLYVDDLFNAGDKVSWTESHLHWSPKQSNEEDKIVMMPIRILGVEEVSSDTLVLEAANDDE